MKCETCLKTFENFTELKAHSKSHRLSCQCGKSFSNLYNLKRHKSENCKQGLKQINPRENKFCNLCRDFFPLKTFNSHLRSAQHIRRSLTKIDEGCFVYKSALKNRLIIYRIHPTDLGKSEKFISIKLFLNSLKKCVENVLEKETFQKKTLKFRLNVIGIFSKGIESDHDLEQSEKNFYSNYRTQTLGDSVKNAINDCINELATSIDEFEEEQSGWSIVKLNHVDVEIAQVNFVKTGSFIELPKKIKEKKCVINVKNKNDSKCLLYSLLSYFFSDKIMPNRRQNPNSYKKYFNFFNLSGIEFPVNFAQIRKFERQNIDKKISITIFHLNGSEVDGPLYKSVIEKENHINLLYLEEGEKSHFCYITNLSRLIRSQLTSVEKEIFFCNNCLNFFRCGRDLELHHSIGCGNVRIVMPSIKKNYIQFEKYQARHQYPVAVYSDIESLIENYASCEPRPDSIFTHKIGLHSAVACAYNIWSVFPIQSKLRVFKGLNCIENYFDALIADAIAIFDTYLSKSMPMLPVDEEMKKKLEEQKECVLCEKDFSKFEKKVIDHDHATGQVVGMAHSSCNLKAVRGLFIPVIHHSSAHYDNKILISHLAKKYRGSITVIPRTKEHYVQFSLHVKNESNKKIELRFIDSYLFLSESLSSLTLTMNNKCPMYEHFNIKTFPNGDFHKNPRKQFLPYEYLTSLDRLEEKTFPPASCFFNSLRNEGISDEDYAYAKQVFESLKRRSLCDYLVYYLSCDVFLLQDIFQNFRETSMKQFHLDPLWFSTLGGLSFESCKLKIKQRVYLIEDPLILQLFIKDIRGGVCNAIHRFAESNNKYLKAGYVKEKGPETYIAYLDCVGLYTFTMQNFKFPLKSYAFVEDEEEFKYISSNLLDLSPDSDEGYYLLVDIKYPSYLHNSHSDLPFLPEHIKRGNATKLICSLYDKKNYFIHYLHLKLALRHGLILEKIHRIVKFQQSFWLRDYLVFCTELRKVAKTEIESLVIKKASNLIYGKMVESLSKRRNVKLLTKWKDSGNRLSVSKETRSVLFKSFSIFGENLAAVELLKTRITYDRPVAVGHCILELSKLHFYSFYYNTMRMLIEPSLIKIGYVDTDAFIFIVNCDIYEIIRNNSHLFDTSNYGAQNVFNISPQNKKVVGLFKDEVGGKIIRRMVCIRPKVYSIEYEDDNQLIEINKLKSVNRAASKLLGFKHYLKVLREKSVIYSEMFRIFSSNQILETIKIRKKALSGDDDKRIILEDGVSTLAIGHYRTLIED